MAKINVLPKNVAELIAAGEVVERPASVVKELVENALDAGAKSITVEIKNGGVKYIRVTDNGCGISREDLPTAFISHATSKISGADDLDAILTLGFRGEALPSIAAVSHLTVLTKTAGEETGSFLAVDGGEVGQTEDAGCPQGTTFTVRDLFYNTPARMKFLKKDTTEGIYVSDVVSRTAIARPDVRFSFIRDGRQMMSTPGSSDLFDTIYAVHGKEIAESLIKCEGEYNSVRVSGFISKPLNNRPNRNYQYFFVNRRFVKIPAAAAALDEGYRNSIMVGKFPMCFLNIEIPAGKIDVNVHPAKTEIRFSDEKAVFEAIFYASRSALARGDTARPGIDLAAAEKNAQSVRPAPAPKADQLRFDLSGNSASSQTERGGTAPLTVTEEHRPVFNDTSSFFDNLNKNKTTPPPAAANTPDEVSPAAQNGKTDNPSAEAADEQEEKQPERKPFTGFTDYVSAFAACPVTAPVKSPDEKKCEVVDVSAGGVEIVSGEDKGSAAVIGEAFGTYILVERAGRLLFIDKHAAHERMIFNSLMKDGSARGAQVLMLPVTVNLPANEYSAVLDNLSVFEKAGYAVEDFGGNCVIVREIPTELCDTDVREIVTEIAGKLSSGNFRPVTEKLEWLYDSTACRAAIKAGTVMKPEETERFVRELLADESIKYCPHGRPVMFELTKREIEKQFGRLG